MEVRLKIAPAFHTFTKERENPLKQLLARLDFDKATFDEDAKMLRIPFMLKLKHGEFKAELGIPSSLEWHKAIVYALKEELNTG